MPRRTIGFLLLALLLAAGCIRLGLWQLQRLAARRAVNSVVERRLAAPPAPFDSVAGDSTARYRSVAASGVYDYDRELVLASRSRDGSPGVNFLTPLRVPGSDTAILVNRGWVYAPDGQTVESVRWRERDSVTVRGFIETFFPGGTGPAGSPTRPRLMRRTDRDSIAARMPYPIAGVYLVARDSGGSPDSTPVRLPAPSLAEGPHQSYALQWFAFATIAIVGAGVVAAGERRRPR